MQILKQILEKTREIDERFKRIDSKELDNIQIKFQVPKFHPRAKEIASYNLSSLRIKDLPRSDVFNITKNHLFLIDESISKSRYIQDLILNKEINTITIKAIEYLSKTKPFLDNLIKEKELNDTKDLTIVVIGGGLLLNIGAYLSEKLSSNLILFPTTVLSMADGSGGKVRINFLDEDRAYKHFYKSFYEPNAIFLDFNFLDFLPEDQIKIGLVEIIKHGLFQSSDLYNFLLNSGVGLLKDKNLLKRAILWTESLKMLCLEVDVEENENGSRRILRGGHDFSDRIEEDKKLKIPHGIAVAIGIVKQFEMEKDKKNLERALKIFKILNITHKIEDFN